MSNKSLTVPTFAEVQAARLRLHSRIHMTPVVTSKAIDDRVGAAVFFKCENLQKTGSFKIRGAINAVSQLTDAQLTCGVVTHSSGNHAAALAYAARLFKTTAHIVMPDNSSAIKLAAVKNYGGRIILCESNLAARLSVASAVQTETGGTLIPPFDHPQIIAGQGTCAMEFLEQVPNLDVIIAPIGGGGLMSGTCLAAKSLSPGIEVIGAEPTGADDAYQSKLNNRLIPQSDPQTIADGLRTGLGELTWPFIRDWVDQIICVTDEETIAARRFFCERTKLIIEPSSAVALAVQFKRNQDHQARPQRIGIIISGGNVEI